MSGDILQQAEFPEAVLVLDFETYFDADYTLKKMTTVEYIADPRFEFTGLGIQVFNHPMEKMGRVFVDGLRVPKTIAKLKETFGRGLHNCTVVAANVKFDLLILAHHFDLYPPYTVDVQDLGRYYDSRMKQSIEHLAKEFKLSTAKGDTKQFKGLHCHDMNETQRRALKAYCLDDIKIEADLFHALLPMVDNPKFELKLAAHTLRLYTKPTLEFDYELAGRLKESMQSLLDDTLRPTGLEVGDFRRPTVLVPALQALLPAGETVPMKKGKKGMIPAMAKDDEGLKLLLKHKDKGVREFAEAKVAAQSWPGHIKRVNSLTVSAQKSDGLVRVPLKYYGCHTGRWSGEEKVNLQNLGGTGRGSAMHRLIGEVRGCLRAPEGYSLVAVDAAQIEARALAWIAGQLDLLYGFAKGEDVYSSFASHLFGKPVWKVTEEDYESSLHNPEELRGIKIQRGFGKDAILGCVAEGTSILTDSGHKPIQDITVNDRVWDGHSFVHHQGVVPKGKKKCININGTWLTPEHEILTWDGWTTAAELSTHNHSQEWFMENLRWLRSQKAPVGGSSPSNVVAPVVEHLLRQETILSQENLHAVLSVLKEHPAKLRAIKHMWGTHQEHACLTGFVLSLADVRPDLLRDMVKEVLESGPNGSMIESLLLSIWQRYLDTTIQNLKLIGPIMTGGMNQEISGLLHDGSIGSILAGETPGSGNRSNVRGAGQCSREKHQFKSSVANTAQAVLPTYDILNAGRWHRFQTDGLMCSNCGYGMGSDKFFDRCYTNDALRPMFDSGQYDKVFIEQLVKTYRRKYDRIPAFWKQVEKLFRWPIKYPGQSTSYEVEGRELLKFNMVGSDLQMTLPSGRVMYYRHASVNADGEIKYKGGPKWCYLWGGSITENLIQALCRDLFGGWLLEIERRGHKVVHHCHDETITCVPDHRAEAVMADMIDVMTHGPEWSEGLPFATDGFISKAYKK